MVCVEICVVLCVEMSTAQAIEQDRFIFFQGLGSGAVERHELGFLSQHIAEHFPSLFVV
jgi:hypothetical protein